MTVDGLVIVGIILIFFSLIFIGVLIHAFKHELQRLLILLRAILTKDQITFLRHYSAHHKDLFTSTSQPDENDRRLDEEPSLFDHEVLKSGGAAARVDSESVLDLGELWETLFNHFYYVRAWISVVLGFFVPLTFISAAIYYDAGMLIAGAILAPLINLIILDFERAHRATFVAMYIRLNVIVDAEQERAQSTGTADVNRVRPSAKLVADHKEAMAAAGMAA